MSWFVPKSKRGSFTAMKRTQFVNVEIDKNIRGGFRTKRQKLSLLRETFKNSQTFD